MELDTWLLLADCTDPAWAPTITDLKNLVDALTALDWLEAEQVANGGPLVPGAE